MFVADDTATEEICSEECACHFAAYVFVLKYLV